MRRFKTDGTPDGVVDLPAIGGAGGFQGGSDDDEAFFIFTSFDTPITVYHYSVSANSSEVWAEPGLAADFSNIVVEQRFYTSKDGTRVPVFIVRNRDVTEPAPTAQPKRSRLCRCRPRNAWPCRSA